MYFSSRLSYVEILRNASCNALFFPFQVTPYDTSVYHKLRFARIRIFNVCTLFSGITARK